MRTATDHYRTLGVASSAAPAEIKRRYRERARQLHPDHAGAASTRAFQELQAAYAVLSDPDARARHDQQRAAREPGPPPHPSTPPAARTATTGTRVSTRRATCPRCGTRIARWGHAHAAAAGAHPRGQCPVDEPAVSKKQAMHLLVLVLLPLRFAVYYDSPDYGPLAFLPLPTHIWLAASAYLLWDGLGDLYTGTNGRSGGLRGSWTAFLTAAAALVWAEQAAAFAAVAWLLARYLNPRLARFNRPAPRHRSPR